MPRVAIFVDAGYLFAQGFTALTGAKQPRSSLALHVSATIDELISTTRAKGVEQKLLRIYWYDGARGASVLPSDHAEIARTAFVKLRLGMINGVGQQKGVDSLIVTDLIELARNRAIDDAVLLSGDDDIRVGVSIAQTFGVCVHLIGIAPSIGSQSPLLLQESDTTTEWDSAIIGRRLSLKSRVMTSIVTGTAPPLLESTLEDTRVIPEARRELTQAIETFFRAQTATKLTELIGFWSAGNQGLPPEIDRPLLASCRSYINRRLDPHESQYMRHNFSELVRQSGKTCESTP